ncbi:MAG: pyrroline-5-carboxylate reductase [Candidatus Nanopelagicales bacterium]
MKIGFVGAGNMGQAILKGLIASGLSNNDLLAVTKNLESSKKISQEFKINASNDIQTIKDCDVVFLGVKPQNISEVLPEIKINLKNDALLISLAVGIKTESIEKIFDNKVKVIRAMPNTPALVGKGVTGLAKGANATENDLEIAQKLFLSVGKVVVVYENLIDVVAAASGSGPAYYFYVTEALTQAAIELGLSKDVAQVLVNNTFIGSAHLFENSNEDVSELRKKVTSPKGTTLAALENLDQNNFKEIWKDALTAAIKRAREISNS